MRLCFGVGTEIGLGLMRAPLILTYDGERLTSYPSNFARPLAIAFQPWKVVEFPKNEWQNQCYGETITLSGLIHDSNHLGRAQVITTSHPRLLLMLSSNSELFHNPLELMRI